MKTNYHSPWAKVHHGTGTKLAWITNYDPSKPDPFRGHCVKGPWLHALNGKRRPIQFYKTKGTLRVIASWREMPSPHAYLHPKPKNLKP